MKAITIKPYDPKFPTYFELEKRLISKYLDEESEIHHIGSTAVPGLGGKNVLDILILTPTKRKALKLIKTLEKIGYSYKEKAGDKYRIFFNKNRIFGKKKVHIHLHLMWKTYKYHKRHLIFRDYLRKHPEEAKRYYSLKKIWAKKAGNKPEKYTEMKTKYIKEILRKAKLEKSTRKFNS